MIKIAMDCLGGDKSPDANIEGSLNAMQKRDDLFVTFFGDKNVIDLKINEIIEKNQALKSRKDALLNRIEIVHAPEEITGDDHPINAVRLKKNSSMICAIKALRENDDISALISSGASGTLVGASILRIGRLKGVRRPAFCPILPTMNGKIVAICDSGANTDVTPEQIHQYAVMASAYLSCVFGVKNPKVALLNVGVEEEKGDDLHRAAYALLKNDDSLNFLGNMESRDLLSGKYDLIACDAFSGNVLIKSTEGACLEMLKRLKKDLFSSLRNKIGALFLKKTLTEEKEFMDYRNYGGSVLLGLEKTVIKCHGGGNVKTIEKCIEQALAMQDSNLGEKITAALNQNKLS